MSDSGILCQSVGDVHVITFNNARMLDEVSIRAIADDLMNISEGAVGGKMLLDFDGVEYMSSAVLGKLMALFKKCKKDKTKLTLCSIHPTIMEVFKITNLQKIFDIKDSQDTALKAFQKGFFR